LINGNGALRNIAYSRDRIPRKDFTTNCKKLEDRVAGYWLWQVNSLEEAIAWVKRCPNPMPGDSEIEIRPVFEADDFGPEFTPELREQEDRIREMAEKLQKS
jgi:hypothetical protein